MAAAAWLGLGAHGAGVRGAHELHLVLEVLVQQRGAVRLRGQRPLAVAAAAASPSLQQQPPPAAAEAGDGDGDAEQRQAEEQQRQKGAQRRRGGARGERERSRSAMTGKAKPKKHTAKEIAAKIDAATTNRGGGKAGQADRLGQVKGGHAKLACPLCRTPAPDIKSMQIHHEAKHPKLPFEPEKLVNLHTNTPAPAETSTANANANAKPKPGVRGSLKK